jgi:hypothetical protein
MNQLLNAREVIRDFETSTTPTRLNALSTKRVGKSVQCSAKAKTGRRCRKKTIRSGLCMTHLNRDQNLRIKKSNIPGAGLGLFSGDKPIARYQTVVPYTGQFSPTEIRGDYVLEVNRKHYINGNRHIDTASFANDCRQVNKRAYQCNGNNTCFHVNQKKKQAWVKATKTIPPSTEVFVPYGEYYWKPIDDNRKWATKSVKLKKRRGENTIAQANETIVF